MDLSLPNKILHSYWGYEDFRDPQKEIILSILEGTDTIALLPTGAGKSICYQVPALMKQGTCIVISPLLALIKDQAFQLKRRLIPAEYISSEQTPDQQIGIFNKLKNNELKLLYVSPERLLSKAFLKIIKDIEISFLAVDEAHCISEWGNDFRPSYQQIKDFREYIGMEIPCMALTATATEKVLSEIIKKLELKRVQVFKKSYERENLSLHILKSDDKLGQIERILTRYKGSGIIYCRTRSETKNLSQILKNKGLDVDFFHAGLSTQEKVRKQNEWTLSDTKVLISTNAFGMGIDKENVRLIIHLSPPYSLENYYQEVGRAGRDGHLSHAFLFWNESEFSDISSSLTQSISSRAEYEKIIRYLYSVYGIAPNESPENIFDFDLHSFQQKTKINLNKIITVLEYLNNCSIIQWKYEPSDSLIQMNFPIERLDTNFFGKDSEIIEKIARKITGVFSYQVKFNEKKLAESLLIPHSYLHKILVKYHQSGDITYIDGNKQKMQFLVPRNDKAVLGEYWNKFSQIQENKLLKYKELEFFIQNKKYCRMRLILGYFGEKSHHNCEKCDICLGKIKKASPLGELQLFIRKKPRSREEIYAEFHTFSFEEIHEYLQELISEEKIKLLNFNTYSG
ncbi:MAG: RecQ family ATP-dependent DNA helicase [Flavobacteriaceae bacterium]|jgi:ATP-dependent DNA helicase RecQ|nr:RecQ family ATP-dependent DNA helicase [Flavobacteriaceae bacterium]